MSKSLWWRLLALVAAVGVGFALSANPWQEALKQRERAAQERADQQAAEDDRARLLAERASLEGPAGQERLARERGYRHPNERPLEVKTNP